MHEQTLVRRPVLSPELQRDLGEALIWSEEAFGTAAAVRYRVLILQAFRDLAADAERAGFQARPEIAISGLRTYHILLSAGSALQGGA